MAFPPAGNVLVASVYGTVNAQRTLTSFHWAVDEPIQAAQSASDVYSMVWVKLNTGGSNDLITPFRAATSTDWILEKVRLQLIYPARYRFSDQNVNQTGAIASPVSVQNVCGNTTKITAFGGRRQQGRWRWPGLPDNGCDNGFLSVGQLNLYLALTNAALQDLDFGFGNGLLSSVLYHTYPNANPKYDTLVTGAVGTTIRCQRSRTIGKGE